VVMMKDVHFMKPRRVVMLHTEGMEMREPAVD